MQLQYMQVCVSAPVSGEHEYVGDKVPPVLRVLQCLQHPGRQHKTQTQHLGGGTVLIKPIETQNLKVNDCSNSAIIMYIFYLGLPSLETTPFSRRRRRGFETRDYHNVNNRYACTSFHAQSKCIETRMQCSAHVYLQSFLGELSVLRVQPLHTRAVL